MSYGSTYSREPTKEELSNEHSLVSCLCDEVGYNREHLEGIELESKVNIYPSSLWTKKKTILRIGEELELPEPYSYDLILPNSSKIHSCYAFVDSKREKLIPAFTRVKNGKWGKIKLKGATEKTEMEEITLLKRSEKNFEKLSPLELTKHISEIARESEIPLRYIGSFLKHNKEAFVFNPVSGRIFVIATNICKSSQNRNELYQIETEYYGQINGFNASGDVEEELATITRNIIPSLKHCMGQNSTLTKFEWLTKIKS